MTQTPIPKGLNGRLRLLLKQYGLHVPRKNNTDFSKALRELLQHVATNRKK